MVSPLVSTEWLKAELEKHAGPKSKLIVLDTAWIPTMGSHSFYLRSHIPGAQHFDIKGCGEPTMEVPRFIPECSLFQQYIRSLGVCKDSHVIVYDRDDGDSIITAMADRTWWLFRLFGHNKVSILDGGLHKWMKAGYQTSSGNENIKLPEGNVECQIDTKLIRNFDEMQAIVNAESSQLIDTRLEEHFDGTVAEPSEFTSLILEDSNLPALKKGEMCAGHMQNAKNIPFIELKKANSPEHLSREEYSQIFQKVGINLEKPITATCYIGHSACILTVAAALCGRMDVAVYAGSWTEWGQKKVVNKSKC